MCATTLSLVKISNNNGTIILYCKFVFTGSYHRMDGYELETDSPAIVLQQNDAYCTQVQFHQFQH